MSANNDAAFYTSISTDLVVSTSSTPAHLLANDLDIDGGAITSSVVANPTSGTLITFGTNGTFTYRPNTARQFYTQRKLNTLNRIGTQLARQ